jgi:hypothetical protein
MARGNQRGERPIEQPAVKTTIVGGRPPGPGKSVGTIPRGIEVLVKKASVDADFRRLLLEKRAEAASEIGLALEPAEAAMLDAVPAAQLEAIIASTTVAPVSRAAFLGKAAAVMLAALGAASGCDEKRLPEGILPDRPPVTKGNGADRPPEKVKDMQEPAPPPPTPPSPDNAAPTTTGVRPDVPPPKPKSQTPSTTAPSEQPMMPMAGAIPRPIPRTTTKGIQPDRP